MPREDEPFYTESERTTVRNDTFQNQNVLFIVVGFVMSSNLRLRDSCVKVQHAF